ncbi:MAG: hypothetical protein ISR48_11270 [Alphaproteobacteria bacterium]|nr:hypothetical protein [Alphaproteobacteria bacterium]
MKAPVVLAWSVVGLAAVGASASFLQGVKMENTETVVVTTTVPVREKPSSDFKVVDLGLFKVQKVRGGKSVRFEVLKVEIEVYKGAKIEKLAKLSPRLRQDFYMVLRKKMTRVPDTGAIALDSPKLKKKLISLARKRLGKGVVHDVQVTDHQKAVREYMKEVQGKKKKKKKTRSGTWLEGD